MGKKLKVQRRGRGTPTFKAKKTGKIAPTRYPIQGEEALNGVIRDLLHEPGRGAPLAYVELEGGAGYFTAAPEGVHIDQSVSLGPGAPLKIGNVRPLGKIPEGTMVCNVELRPGDGGKLARSSGSFAIVVAHIGDKTTLKLPSKKSIEVNDNCRATIGIVSGGGRKEKPFMKAGEKHYAKRAKGQIYPVTKGVKMTAASHPHGGGRHRRPGKSTTVSRHAPPGKKVGLIAARNSGKKKRRRRS
ncbi:MAG: 50S ribosomal protein L2 [Candidatus Bathyarchaeota archaeon]|nr:MAG: 50S ribosomal protein L2 [Candidatus Bathyarchaeota archaeon]